MVKQKEKSEYNYFLDHLQEEDMAYLHYLHQKEEKRGHWKAPA